MSPDTVGHGACTAHSKVSYGRTDGAEFSPCTSFLPPFLCCLLRKLKQPPSQEFTILVDFKVCRGTNITQDIFVFPFFMKTVIIEAINWL